MNDKQWKELMELKKKTSLSPKTDYRLARLEGLLSSAYYLRTFSAKEKANLIAQFDELSEQDQLDLIARITNKTHPNFFHLSDEEREQLRTARQELSFHERARLSDTLIHTDAGCAWIDLGEVFITRIEIDDNSSRDREKRPYAYICFSDSYRSRVETVDILESVRNNAAAIGHPAVVFAIYHWQRLINAKRVLQRDDVLSSDVWGELEKEIWGGLREVRVAESNLKELGKALLKGAKSRAIPNQMALALKMESLGLGVKDTDTVLHKAWERLASRFIKPTDEVKETLTKIEAKLLKFERYPYTDDRLRRVSSASVMRFLKDGGRKGGRRFIGNNTDGISLRPRWKSFLYTFAAWYFGLKRSVVQEYLEKAAKQNVPDKEVYRSFGDSPTSDVHRVLSYLFATPLIAVREPIWLNEFDAGLHSIPIAIENAASEKKSNEGK